MRIDRLLITGLAAAAFCAAFSLDAQAQSRKPKPQEVAAAQPAPRCLRALDGSCTKEGLVEVTRLRAQIIPSVRVSYIGTPMGTIGGPYIPFERFFQDNPIVFGLPTAQCNTCNIVRRTK
jgi:hypothetical protein